MPRAKKTAPFGDHVAKCYWQKVSEDSTTVTALVQLEHRVFESLKFKREVPTKIASKPSEFIGVLVDIGEFCAEQSAHALAETVLEAALVMQKKIAPNDQKRRAEILKVLGTTALKLERWDKARELLNQAFDILQPSASAQATSKSSAA